MNILIVKTSAIGDVTHTIPALNCLRKQYPSAHITWLVEEAAADLLAGHPSLDRLLVSKRKTWLKEFRDGAWLGSLKKFSRFVCLLRDRKYDLVLDFQGLLKSSLWVMLSGGKRRVGFGRGMQHSECSWLFLNERIPAVDMEIHALDRGLLLLKEIAVDCPRVRYNFPITSTMRKGMVDRLATGGFQNKTMPLVVVNPQTTWWTKLWYSDRFAQVVDRLLKQGCFVVLSGGPSDIDINQAIADSTVIPCLNLTGQSTLKELSTLYDLADVVISTDTGPMHIAAAVATPVVALFGPTAPWRTGPHGEQHIVVRSGLSCSPCFKRKCSREYDKECMSEITVEQVVDAALKILRRPGNRHGLVD